MDELFEIYFADLNEDAKKRFLDFAKKISDELAYGILPIATITQMDSYYEDENE